MGELIDRAVHPLYSVMAFVCALTVGILLISAVKSRRGIQKNHKMIFLWVIFFCVQDGIWGLLAAHVIRNDLLLFISSNVFHVSAVMSALFFTLYFLSRLNITAGKRKLIHFLVGSVSLVQLVMIAVNLYSHFMFFVDEAGIYQTTDARAILFYMQFGTYLLIGFVTLIETAREKEATGNSLSTVFFVNMAPVLFSVFQRFYPDAPADSIGFSIACIIIGLFLMRDTDNLVLELEQAQEKLSDYKKAVLSDALIALEVNLNRDVLYYGVWKDDSGREVPLMDIVGLDTPCSYDSYIYRWNSGFVSKNFETDFSEKTDRDYLLQIFNSGSPEVTFDYEAETISGRSTWLRHSISMIRNSEGDVIAYSSTKDISGLIEQSKREEAYIRALALEYDAIAVVGIKDGEYTDRMILQRSAKSGFSVLIDGEGDFEGDFQEKLDVVSDFVHPDDREAFTAETKKDNLFNVFENNRTHAVNFRFMDGEGGWMYYQVRFIPLKGDSEELKGMIICERNTDGEMRRELEHSQELEEAKIAAEAANQA